MAALSAYRIREVDAKGRNAARIIHAFNRMCPEVFPELQPRHLERGYWWIAICGADAAGFAGLVPFEPCPSVGYLKRAFVLPAHRGNGIQRRFMGVREWKARDLRWTTLVSECSTDNVRSANNFIRAGYRLCDPEQLWAYDSLYWVKTL